MATTEAVGNANNNFRQQNNVEAVERQNATKGGGNTQNAAATAGNTNNEGNKILAPPKTTEIEVEGVRTVTENNIERQLENPNNSAATNNTAQQNNAKQTQRGVNVDISV